MTGAGMLVGSKGSSASDWSSSSSRQLLSWRDSITCAIASVEERKEEPWEEEGALSSWSLTRLFIGDADDDIPHTTATSLQMLMQSEAAAFSAL